MTYDKLRAELDTIRENQKTTDAILRKIKDLDTCKFERLEKITDTTREYTQRTRKTDDDIINAIDKHARKREALLKRLEQLPPENDTVINELWKLDGIAGEVTRCYYINGRDVKTICKWLDYSSKQIYRMINDSTEKLFYCLSQTDA